MRSEEDIRDRYNSRLNNPDFAFEQDELEWVLSGTQWRDAKKELPEKNGDVLIYCDEDGGSIAIAHYRDGIFDGWSNTTLWQPRPAPPEGV